MTRKYIRLYMWGYQQHFQIVLRLLAQEVVKEMGLSCEIEVLLVGAREPASTSENPVCVEPEDSRWPVSLFTTLLSAIESQIDTHPNANVFYSDERFMAEKPDVIRRDSVTRAVRNVLAQHDQAYDMESFCGKSVLVGEYYVVPVIRIPGWVFKKFPRLKNASSHQSDWSGVALSFLDAALQVLLKEASQELAQPDPGRSLSGNMRNAKEIVRIAATNFLYGLPLAIGAEFNGADLFNRFNLISSLFYEGARGVGRIVLANRDSKAVQYYLRFHDPVPFGEARWARKILQLAENDVAVIADTNQMYGLGGLSGSGLSDSEQCFILEFLDHYHWALRFGAETLLQSEYGVAKLAQEPVSRELFLSNLRRLFPESTEEERERFWTLLCVIARRPKGSMIVVAADAASEARRLAQQGTHVEPQLMSVELLASVSGIDGTIVLDSHGVCHAIGVILDGAATPECTPARGARFNSGVRYVRSSTSNRLAIIVSDDKTVDILPKLRSQISSAVIEREVRLLETATLENYHQPRKWLDEHRFYLDRAQCDRVNVALDRIEKLSTGVGEMVIITERLSVDPDMNASYLIL